MTLSANEQWMIELINRARLDPEAEAARFGMSLNEGLSGTGLISGSSQQVLAPDALLEQAARAHSQWQIDTDTFSHTGAGGSQPSDRIRAAGYELTGLWRTGENLSFRGSTGPIDLGALILQQHEGLFRSPGHRSSLLHENFREIGLAQVEGRFTQNATTYNVSMVTQNFALSGSGVFLTGVVYADLDGNDFYTPGEGRAGTGIAASGRQTVSQAAGGYALELAAAADVAVTLGAGIRLRLDLRAGNVKLDLVDGNRIFVSGSAVIETGVAEARLLGTAALDLTGGAGSELLIGNSAANRIAGGAGNDTIHAGAGNDSVNGGTGQDLVWLGEGHDRYEDSAENGPGGADTVYGGDGNDWIHGGGGPDQLYGDAGNDTIYGGQGNDRIYGGDGADQLYGGLGNDTVYGGNGRDLVLLGDGDDRYEDTTQSGIPGQDTVYGGNGNDWIHGGGGDDVLHGDAGYDTIYGGQGNDRVYGGNGFDLLFGGIGDDVIHGGNGNDTLTGGAGADHFVFLAGERGASRITDFGNGDDLLLLDAGLWSGTLTAAGVVEQFAEVTSAGVLFDFGSQTVLLQGVTSTAGLAEDIVFL